MYGVQFRKSSVYRVFSLKLDNYRLLFRVVVCLPAAVH